MNRRDFLASGSGAFFIASAGRVFGALAPSERVRLAIVGCREGGRGRAVMEAAMKVPGVDIVCVCDVDGRARDWAAACVEKTSGVKPRKEKDFRKVLEDASIDGILSETPDHFHAYSAIMAMRAGKAVYVEKPCGYCPSECELVEKVQRETGVVFQMGSQRRSSVSYRQAFDFVRRERPIGELKWAKCWYRTDRASIGRGKLSAVPDWLDWDLWQGPAPRRAFHDNYVHYNWHWFRHWGTAESGNNAPHFLDAARWALGVGRPERIACSGGTFFGKDDDYEWPDTFNMSFNFAGGRFITYELTSRCENKPYMDIASGAMIHGTSGSMFLKGDEVFLFDASGAEMWHWQAGGETKMGSLTNPTNDLDVGHVGDFVRCLRAHDVRTRAPASEGAISSAMPLWANIALDTHEEIVLDPATGAPKGRAAAERWAREYAKGWEL